LESRSTSSKCRCRSPHSNTAHDRSPLLQRGRAGRMRGRCDRCIRHATAGYLSPVRPVTIRIAHFAKDMARGETLD
jgi:hypothetical protein